MLEAKLGVAYFCPTPLGNLEDITFRTVRVLQEVDVIMAEDTRRARILLGTLNINIPVHSFYRENEKKKTKEVIDRLRRGENVAVISDAGMPGLADPGEVLVAALIANDLPFHVLPGPNAAVTALVASGFATQPFRFGGFMPRQKSAQNKLLRSFLTDPSTLVFYEAPHRLSSTLLVLGQVLGDRRAMVARELTKIYETYHRGSLLELADFFQRNQAKGEITLVVAGATRYEPQLADEQVVKDVIAANSSKSLKPRALARYVAEQTGWASRDVYELMEMMRDGELKK